MSRVDTTGWTRVGETSTCDLYEVKPDILAVVPHAGARDTAESARELTAWQYDYWMKRGHTGSVVVFVDGYVDLDPAASAVYAEASEGALTHAGVIITATFWGRTVGTAYLAVKKPPMPTRFFATLEEAMPWLEQTNETLRRDVSKP